MADPNFEVVPDFADEYHEAIREALREANLEDDVQVIARLTAAWQAGHARRLEAWNVRKAAEAREAQEMEIERREQLEQEERDAADEAERTRLDAEKKKAKMNTFTPGSAAPDILSLPPSQYALQKLTSFDYVELWYFSLPGRTDAAKYGNKSQADDTFGLAKLGDQLTVRSIASVRASKNVLPDEELTFVDFLQARNSFLDFAKKADWPRENLDALSKFFWYLETHTLLQVPLGQKTILTYASRVRHDWHRELKAGRGYDISLINGRLMSSISDEIRALDEQQTKSQASASALEPLKTLLTSLPFPYFAVLSSPHKCLLDLHCRDRSLLPKRTIAASRSRADPHSLAPSLTHT